MKNFSDILSQAKEMQEKMKETHENLKKIEVEGSSGGLAVKVILNGEYDHSVLSFFKLVCSQNMIYKYKLFLV